MQFLQSYLLQNCLKYIKIYTYHNQQTFFISLRYDDTILTEPRTRQPLVFYYVFFSTVFRFFAVKYLKNFLKSDKIISNIKNFRKRMCLLHAANKADGI